MRMKLGIVSMALFLVMVGSCGDDDSGGAAGGVFGSSTGKKIAEKVEAANGGKVTLEGSVLATVDLAAGMLDADTMVTIEQFNPGSAIASAVVGYIYGFSGEGGSVTGGNPTFTLTCPETAAANPMSYGVYRLYTDEEIAGEPEFQALNRRVVEVQGVQNACDVDDNPHFAFEFRKLAAFAVIDRVTFLQLVEGPEDTVGQ